MNKEEQNSTESVKRPWKDYSKQDFIDAYTTSGFSLTQLQGKSAYKNNWPNTPYKQTLNEKDFPDNIGVVLSDEDLIIDYDPRNQDKGDKPLSRLMETLKLEAFKTFIVRTGGGGYHIYLKKDPHIKIKTKHNDYPGLEFLSKGHQIVSAGSIHPKTSRLYMPIGEGNLNVIAQAPDILLNLIEIQIRDFDPNDEGTLHDTEANRNRFEIYLNNCRVAVSHKDGNPTTYLTACHGKDLGLSKDTTLAMMMSIWNPKCLPPWELSDMKKIVNSAYKTGIKPIGCNDGSKDFEEYEAASKKKRRRYVNELKKNLEWDYKKDNLVPKISLPNTVTMIRALDYSVYDNPISDLFVYNEFSDKIEFTRKAPWHNDDHKITSWSKKKDTIGLKYLMTSEWHFDTSTPLLNEAVIQISMENSYHPVKDYLNRLEWNGESELDGILIECAGVEDTPYVREVGKNMMISAIARSYEPGCKVDNMLILEGTQDLGKSTFCKILSAPWFTDMTIDLNHEKDTIIKMRGSWIIEVSEFNQLRGRKVEALKSFLTRSSDNYRPLYEEHNVIMPRESIFIGTLNPNTQGTYLPDLTGNRRYWPVYTTNFNLKKLKQKKDQYFAEAKARYLLGEPWHITDPKLKEVAQREQQLRTHKDPWGEAISNMVYKLKVSGEPIPKFVTPYTIASEFLHLPLNRITDKEYNRIYAAMDLCPEWEYGDFYDPEKGKTLKCYRYKG